MVFLTFRPVRVDATTGLRDYVVEVHAADGVIGTAPVAGHAARDGWPVLVAQFLWQHYPEAIARAREIEDAD